MTELFMSKTEAHGDVELTYAMRDGVLLAELYTGEDEEPLEIDICYSKAKEVIEEFGYDSTTLRKLGSVDPNNDGSSYGYWVMKEVLT